MKKRNATAIYHHVRKHEGFERTAQALFDLVRAAQRDRPGVPRLLYLDIEGHRNKAGGFTADMVEIQEGFICGFLMPYLTEAHIPLIRKGFIKNEEGQKNNLPERLKIGAPA